MVAVTGMMAVIIEVTGAIARGIIGIVKVTIKVIGKGKTLMLGHI